MTNLTVSDIDKVTVPPETTLKSAMMAINVGAGRVLFVVDGKGRLIGSVTDGDIRRAILSGAGFNQPVLDIMFKSPRSVRRQERGYRKKAEKLIVEQKLTTVPVLDEARCIVELIHWHEFLEKHPDEPVELIAMTNPVVIMAGGKGSRLDPFTKILPKPLIPLGEKPVLEIIMDNFHKHGFNNFIFTLNYKKELIKLYFKENSLSYNIQWVEEEEYLGTAGSLGLLKDKIKETFFVCNCDILLENDYRNILLWHRGEKADMTIIGCHKEVILPYGTLEVQGGVLKSIYEKPKYDMIINTGVYVLEPSMLELLSGKEHLDMNHLVDKAIAHNRKVTVYPVYGGWFDIGQWKEYRESLYLLEHN